MEKTLKDIEIESDAEEQEEIKRLQLRVYYLCKRNSYTEEEKEKIRAKDMIRYYYGKPKTLERIKKYQREHYQRDPIFRANKIARLKHHYNNNKEYFAKYVRTEEYSNKQKVRRSTKEYKEYQLLWKSKNKEKIDSYYRKYRGKSAIRSREYYKLNKDRLAQYGKEYYRNKVNLITTLAVILHIKSLY